MNENTQKEMFSYAYIRAVASVAGYSVEEKNRVMDNVGIDLTVEMPGEIGEMLFPKFDAQVKCTSSSNFIKEKSIKFPLPVKNYKTLINTKVYTPQLLIVVIVPEEVSDWLKISEESLIIRKCGYWVSLKGQPPTKNTENITVEIPRKNVLSPENLRYIMETISNGEDL